MKIMPVSRVLPSKGSENNLIKRNKEEEQKKKEKEEKSFEEILKEKIKKK